MAKAMISRVCHVAVCFHSFWIAFQSTWLNFSVDHDFLRQSIYLTERKNRVEQRVRSILYKETLVSAFLGLCFSSSTKWLTKQWGFKSPTFVCIKHAYLTEKNWYNGWVLVTVIRCGIWTTCYWEGKGATCFCWTRYYWEDSYDFSAEYIQFFQYSLGNQLFISRVRRHLHIVTSEKIAHFFPSSSCAWWKFGDIFQNIKTPWLRMFLQID